MGHRCAARGAPRVTDRPDALVLDTSILIDIDAPPGLETAISVVSIGELQFGLLAAANATDRARRLARLTQVRKTYPIPLPVDDAVAEEWGTLQALVRDAGANPRPRLADLLIAATAHAHRAAVLTHNPDDFRHITQRVTVLTPADL